MLFLLFFFYLFLFWGEGVGETLLMDTEQWEFFSVSPMRHVTSSFKAISMTNNIYASCRAFDSRADTTFSNDSDLSLSGFEHPTFRKQSELSIKCATTTAAFCAVRLWNLRFHSKDPWPALLVSCIWWMRGPFSICWWKTVCTDIDGRVNKSTV